MRRTGVAVAVLVLLSSCGSQTAASDAGPGSTEPDPDAYDGPLVLEPDHSDRATVQERSGAAGLALECTGEPLNGGGGDYDSGLTSAQASATGALEDWLDNEAWAYQVPEEGYRVERDDGDRVLLSYDVDGQSKLAFVAADGITDYDGDQGWGIESWAQCDPAEWPAEVTDALGIEVWVDGSEARVATTTISSSAGPEHCGWEDITFLHLGPDRTFLRDTSGELANYLRTTYDGSATVPADAKDSDYRRNGRQLWLTPDAAYLVSVDDPDDVERWPATTQRIACA